MYLKSLELNGFKSFAKKTDLEFGSHIVAIVGPNGSGKSNVAEAFRFVLGEQSMKSMRGKRGEDLIFNGGKTLGKQNRASVKLIFDNRKKLFAVDFDEVSLERVVYRDGVNEYLINGSVVRLRDMLELLAQANIGSSGHHIISQGEADRMLNASIKERKEMIEDALGLKIYQYKKQESEKKLEKTGENISQVNALRKEIAPHIKFLLSQLEKVKRADDVRHDLLSLYQEYLKREEVYLHKERGDLGMLEKGPREEMNSLDKRIAEIKLLLERDNTFDKKSSFLLSLEGEIRVMEEEEISLRSEISRVEGEISAEERALSRLKASKEKDQILSISLSEFSGVKGRIEETIKKILGENDVNHIKESIKEILSIFDNFFSKKSKENTPEEGGIEEEIKNLKEEKDKIGKKLEVIRGKISKAREEYSSLRKEIEASTREGREAEREMFSLLGKRTELVSILGGLKLREEALKRDELSFKEELREAQALLGVEALRYGENNYKEEERAEQEKRRKNVEKLKIRLEELGGAGGDDIRKEHEEATERDAYLSKEIEDLEKSAETLRGLIEELNERLESEFDKGIEKINTEFQKYFTLMFGGGQASLFVIKEEKRRRKKDDLSEDGDEEETEEEEGIDINVALPNKRIRGLNMLSGGERALTSIALLFAISQVNPPPFVILDETDAALDEANSKKYGDMVENLSKHSQLILITHNRETMSRAGILYGVTMGGEGFSKLLSVKFDEAVAVAK